nr:phosphotransferase [Ktedonobacteraceae bacterium]
MNTQPNDNNVSIMELPAIISLLCERANYPLLPEAKGTVSLFVRYLRRKAERGLAIIYTVDDVPTKGLPGQPGQTAAHKAHAKNPNRSVSLTLDEQALDGARIRFSASQAQQTPLVVQASGVLNADELGLSLQTFPADDRLPMLAASCDTTPQGPLFRALEGAAQATLGSTAWHLSSAEAIPVRYKPANRCVIRYNLTVEQDEPSTRRTLAIFGKVYTNPEQARSVYALTRKLYDEQGEDTTHRPILPRPLGISEELGLTFNEAVMPTAEGERLRTGIQALQPQVEQDRAGNITRIILPSEELQLTAQALARLHNSAVRPQQETPRSGAKEAKRARERAALIAARNPTQAAEVQSLAQELATRLETLQPDSYRPAHGGFKASQLLFHSHEVFVVDFDGFCLADAALDVGYFLAYLRPSGLWYQRPGMRQWFTEAAEAFLHAYQQAMRNNASEETVTGIVERARLYEAALLFKIATRRVNRLNSPRPRELAAMLREITLCLS